MSVAIACYGRLGPQAESNPRVAELLKRTVDGQHRATVAFKATLASFASQNLVPWTAPIGDITLLLNQWIALLAWERATVFLDVGLVMDPALTDGTYRQIDKVCDEATELSMRSIRMQTEVSQGKRPGNAALVQLSQPPGSSSTAPMVWASLEAVYTRVRADMAYIARLGVPPRMHKVYRALVDSYEPTARQFDYLASQWHGTSATENRVQLVRQAIPLVQHFYSVGQQVWAPYLVGPVYVDIVRSQPLFAKLGLSFDPWILTDPAVVDARVTDRASCQQLIQFWQTVGDPQAAKALQDRLNEELAAESIAIEPSKTYKIAPWQPQYRVVHTTEIGELQLTEGTLFALYPRSVGGKRMLEIRVTYQA